MQQVCGCVGAHTCLAKRLWFFCTVASCFGDSGQMLVVVSAFMVCSAEVLQLLAAAPTDHGLVS